MELITVVKNCRSESDINKWEYILFNRKDRTKSKIELTPKEMINLTNMNKWEAISPLKAIHNGLYDYDEVGLENFNTNLF